MCISFALNQFYYYNALVESSSLPLPPSSQPQQQQNHTQNSKRKKSVMLNLKSGAINSVTFEAFGNYSTRFTGSKQRRRKCLLIGGISLGGLCFFAFGIAISKLFEAETCKCKWVHNFHTFSVCGECFHSMSVTRIGVCVTGVFVSTARTHVLQ